MKLAVISDTHFGYDQAALVQKKNGQWQIGSYYERFSEIIGKEIDYLVMLGDVLDFSIASYQDAYDAAKVFFKQMQQDKILADKGKVVYLAGNHDADIWHIVQHQRHVINKLAEGKLPTEYRHSVACVIDDRDGKGWATLSNTTPKNVSEDGIPQFGGMFLDCLTKPDADTTFYLAYPNLYFVTGNKTILMTHGQYFDAYWSFLGEFMVNIAHKDLDIGNAVDIEEMMQLNFPLNQLACTGIGQSPLVRTLAQKIQNDFNQGKLSGIEDYINRIEDYLDGLLTKWYLELFTDACIKGAGLAAKNMLKEASKKETASARDNPEYCRELGNNPRFKAYLAAVREELGLLNASEGLELRIPSHIIFGHTHVPFGWGESCARLDSTPGDIPVRIQVHNTGGWVYKMENGNRVFCGAELFLYDTATGMRSVRVS